MPYLNYIADEALVVAVRKLITGGLNKIKAVEYNINKNTIDPFSGIFEAAICGMTYEEWVKAEKHRQVQKWISNAIGAFHEDIITSVEGWENLKKKNVVDVVNKKKKIFAEIKNKHNTIKASDESRVYKTLSEKCNKKGQVYEGYTAYLVQIISKNGARYEENFMPSDNTTGKKCPKDELIKVIDGYSFYKLVTGRENALGELYSALPEVINDVLPIMKIDDKTASIFQADFNKLFNPTS